MTSVADESDNLTPDADRKKAQRLFEHARKVADTGQHDYAIELYIQGLSFDPENIEMHTELRRISLTRKATGGKPLGTFKAMPLKKTGKDQKQNLLNAETLLAYDPGNLTYMVNMLKAAQKGGFHKTALWIGPQVMRSNLEGKQDTSIFLMLKELYKEIGEYKLASEALNYAAASRPDDAELQHELRELAAQMTIKGGGYGAGGDFRKSMRDADKQRALQEDEADVRDTDAMAGQIARARQAYEESGHEPGKLMRLVESLAKTEDLGHENEAIELLEQAYKQTNSYRFRYNAEEIKLKQMLRFERSLRDQIEEKPDDESLKKALAEQAQERLVAELKHYQRAAKAYPTDLRLKYEVGKRLFESGQYDEAIPVLQQAQNDAKYREEALILLGRAFLEAGFVEEAADTLRGRIESYQIEGDTKAKEMYYWYGRSLEVKGDTAEATKAYSKIAQWDFGYRDVQNRIRELRAAAQQKG